MTDATALPSFSPSLTLSLFPLQKRQHAKELVQLFFLSCYYSLFFIYFVLLSETILLSDRSDRSNEGTFLLAWLGLGVVFWWKVSLWLPQVRTNSDLLLLFSIMCRNCLISLNCVIVVLSQAISSPYTSVQSSYMFNWSRFGNVSGTTSYSTCLIYQNEYEFGSPCYALFFNHLG